MARRRRDDATEFTENEILWLAYSQAENQNFAQLQGFGGNALETWPMHGANSEERVGYLDPIVPLDDVILFCLERFGTVAERGRGDVFMRQTLTIGRATRTLWEWSRHYGVSYHIVRMRIRAGWPTRKWFAKPGTVGRAVRAKNSLKFKK